MLEYVRALQQTWRSAVHVGWISLCVAVIWLVGIARLAPDQIPYTTEFIGTWLNLWCVWLTVKQDEWCWPTGILGVIFFGIAFFHYHLYSTVALNLIYYVPVQFFGWWAWRKGGIGGTALLPQPSTWWQIALMIIGIIIGMVLWGCFLSTYTDARLIVLDAAVAGISIIAQYVMSWKRLESWIGWIIVDVLSIVLFTLSGSVMAALLYTVFLCLAGKGLFDWSRDYFSQKKIA